MFVFLTNYYLEVLGYLGTSLVIISMMMTNITKLRIFNICGAIISAIYSGFVDAWPVVLLNVVLTTINIYHLTRYFINKRKQSQE